VFKANADARVVEMFDGVTRRTLNSGDRTTLAEITLAKGSVVPMHTHPHEQIGYVVSGRVIFEINGEKRELGAGDSYLIPGGEPHEVHTLEDAICIDIFSPVREEFLD
jgi:quercetin dioxygenase-like cupin family protein